MKKILHEYDQRSLYLDWEHTLNNRELPMVDYSIEFIPRPEVEQINNDILYLASLFGRISIEELHKELEKIKLQHNNLRFIIERVWDCKICENSEYLENDRILLLKVKDFIRIFFYLCFVNCYYDKLEFNRNPDKLFLLLMRQSKLTRDIFFKLTDHLHDDSIVSYLGKNFTNEPGLGEIDNDYLAPNGQWASTLGNIEWYNRTYFSLVVETMPDWDLFVSEKIFKPIAFKHPFIVMGSQYTLKYLKSLGFRTFGHIIDESYDEIENFVDRMFAVIKIVNQLHQDYKSGMKLFDDPISQEVIEHNFNHFYNHSEVEKLYKEQYIDIIKKF